MTDTYDRNEVAFLMESPEAASTPERSEETKREMAVRQEMYDRLRAVNDDVTAAILLLHKPTDVQTIAPECQGCSHECCYASWPCDTVEILAEVHDIPHENQEPL